MSGQSAKEVLSSALDSLLDADRGFMPMAELLPTLHDFTEQFGAPEFVCSMHPLPPTSPAEHAGLEGITEAWDDFGAAFTKIEGRLERYAESARGIALLVEQRARTRHGDVEITQGVAVTFVFERGLLARMEFHIDRDAAQASVGILSPQTGSQP